MADSGTIQPKAAITVHPNPSKPHGSHAKTVAPSPAMNRDHLTLGKSPKAIKVLGGEALAKFLKEGLELGIFGEPEGQKILTYQVQHAKNASDRLAIVRASLSAGERNRDKAEFAFKLALQLKSSKEILAFLKHVGVTPKSTESEAFPPGKLKAVLFRAAGLAKTAAELQTISATAQRQDNNWSTKSWGGRTYMSESGDSPTFIERLEKLVNPRSSQRLEKDSGYAAEFSFRDVITYADIRLSEIKARELEKLYKSVQP
jgi:hypothetical protein